MKKNLLAIFFFPLIVKAQLPSFSWLQTWASSNFIYTEDIKTNIHGDIYLVGRFTGTVDFDPGLSTFSMVAAGTNTVWGDGFILQLDASGKFKWAGAITGINNEQLSKLEIDNQGNIYVFGQSTGNSVSDLDPGTGSYLTPASGTSFLIKLNSQNQFVWAWNYVEPNGTSGQGELQIRNNDLYLGVGFSGTVDFDPGPGVYSVTSKSSSGDFYLLKLDLSGNFKWVITPDSSSAAEGVQQLCVDTSGDVYMYGSLHSGIVDFDPGPGSTIVTHTTSGYKCFLVKYTNAGNFAWVKDFDHFKMVGYDLAVQKNLVYMSGTFLSQYDFDLGPGTYNLTPNGGYDCFLSAFDFNGNFQWAKQIGGSALDIPYQTKSTIPGSLYSTGRFDSTVDFDIGSGTQTITASGANEVFILKTDSVFNFNAVGSIPCPMNPNAGASSIRMAVEPNGDVYISGQFNHTNDFDPGNGTYIATPTGSSNVFLFKLSACASAPHNLNPHQSLYLCSGSSTTITATSTAPINWYSSLSSTNSIGSGSTLSTPSLSAGSYTWYAASGSCSLNSSRLPVIVNVTDPPAFSYSPALVCVGQPATVSLTGASNYTWLPAGVGATISLTPVPGPNSFTVTASDPVINCTSQKTIQVMGMPLPTISVTSPSLICKGALITFTAAGANSYQWNGNLNSPTYTFIASSNGTVNVKGTNTLGSCESTITHAFVSTVCTSINDVKDKSNEILIYPNPTSGKIHFNDLRNSELLIFNTIGMCLGVVQINDSGEADISIFPAGQYLLFLKAGSHKLYSVIKE